MLRRSKLWSWIAFWCVVLAFLWAPAGERYPAVLLSAFAFAAVQSWYPRCRVIAETPLCPWNWALFLFFFELVVLPFSVLALGPSIGVLPQMPSDFAINMGMALNALAFLTFATTYQSMSRRLDASKSERSELRKRTAERAPSRRFIQVQLLLGIVGFFLAFGGIGSFVDYFENPGESVDRFMSASHTLGGVASLFLRPFLGFGLVMLWCGWLDRSSKRKSPRWTALITLLAMLGVILSYGTFTYNRGAFVVPLVAMFAVLLTRGKRVSFGVLTVAGVVLVAVLLLAPLLAVYRNSNLTAEDLLNNPAASEFFAEKIDLLDTIQMYGAGPQYVGFLLEASGWGKRSYLGTTLFPSLVAPIPVLGRTLRESSGPVIYNKMIYGTPDIFDQIIPFSGEMFLNFHIVGVVAGFCFLGMVAFKLQQAFERASSALEIYIWQYAAVWILFLIIGSISVVSQITFYFFWPIYLYFAWKRNALRHPPRLARHPWPVGP